MVCLQDEDRVLLVSFGEQVSYAQSMELSRIIVDIVKSDESFHIDQENDMEF